MSLGLRQGDSSHERALLLELDMHGTGTIITIHISVSRYCEGYSGMTAMATMAIRSWYVVVIAVTKHKIVVSCLGISEMSVGEEEKYLHGPLRRCPGGITLLGGP